MNHFVRPVQIAPEAHLIQSFWKHPAMPMGVQMNTMVLTSRQPVVFDTGVSADEQRWLERCLLGRRARRCSLDRAHPR